MIVSCNSMMKSELPENSLDENYPLVHMVFINLKDNIAENDRKNFISAIEDLANIKSVHYLSYGSFKDLRDPRALEEFDLVIQMQFASEKEYHHYKKDEIHLKLKQMGALLMSGPPSTFHFSLN